MLGMGSDLPLMPDLRSQLSSGCASSARNCSLSEVNAAPASGPMAGGDAASVDEPPPDESSAQVSV